MFTDGHRWREFLLLSPDLIESGYPMKRPVAVLVCIAMAHLAPATAPGKDAETAVLKVFDGDSVIVIDKVTRQDRQLTVSTRWRSC